MEVPMDLVDRFKTIRRDKFTDPPSSAIFMYLDSASYVVQNVLWRIVTSEQWLVCIPLVHELTLIVSVHEHYGHVGAKKYAFVLKEPFDFPNLYRRIRFIVSHCDICQHAKHRTVRFM